MPKKVYIIDNLDCANCAAKIEKKFNDLPEVEAATITFATKQLHLTAEQPDDLIEKLQAIARTVEGEATITPREAQHHHEQHTHEHAHGHGCDHDHECGCGHHHDHDHDCHCGEDHDCHCNHHHHEHEHSHDHEH